MGFGIAVAAGLLVGGALILTMSNQKPETDDMQPQSLDSFGMTKNAEGQVAPMV